MILKISQSDFQIKREQNANGFLIKFAQMDFTLAQSLRTDFQLGRNKKIKKTQAEKAHSNGEKRGLTKPKRNADFRVKPKGLCIFMKSLNLMDLALEKEKINQNNKL